MRKISLFIFSCIFIISSAAFAQESKDRLKSYLSDMNRIVIEVEAAIRNVSMNALLAKNAIEQLAASIEKFNTLKPPSVFAADHNKMLSAFKTLKEGLKLLSESKREKSAELVRSGAELLKDAAIGIRRTAEEQGLVAARARTVESAKPILPPIAGASPTVSPHIASPGVEGEFIKTNNASSVNPDVTLGDMPNAVAVASIPDNTNVLIVEGKIISIGPSIELEDKPGSRLRLDFSPEASHILKDNKIVGIEDLSIGETVYIMYTQENDKKQIVFIRALKQ